VSKKRRPQPPAPPTPPAVVSRFAPSPASLAALTALGAGAALWALLLWGELVASRVGRAPVCALGDPTACQAAWDAPFASWVHRTTGVPVAGWGLAWGLVAFVLPLLALLRTAEARATPSLMSAIRLTAGAGLLAVLVLVAVSAAAGAVCPSCAGTYVVVAGYAGIALFGWPDAGLPDGGRGAAIAGAATLAAFLLLLYPGTRTPSAGDEADRTAMAASTPSLAEGPGTADAERDRRLEQLVQLLAPAQKQALADSLLVYRRSPALELPPPRHLDGPAEAPVRITEWTDVLCSHCAELHRTLATLRDHVPAGSFAVDSRQFPLDAECNPYVQRRGSPVRCLAARAEICLEGHEGADDFVGRLFEGQASLTPAKVYDLASALMPRAKLEACVASAVTARKLREDIETAARYDPDGTPIVAINGRRSTSFGPFLLAMALAGGRDAHPAFAGLPAPDPQARPD
jgi:protein-disulfide isomerase